MKIVTKTIQDLVNAGVKIGNKYRIDHLCSDNDVEVLSMSNDNQGTITLQRLHRSSGYGDPKPYKIPICMFLEDLMPNQWYKYIQIDDERNDI